MPCGFTLGELADSATHEVTAQSVDDGAVHDILFGRYGLIRKAGGGRANRLMEDIEVAFIVDAMTGTKIGPIITSGRHRCLALQLMLKSAGVMGYRDIKVRCSVINATSQAEVQDRIISANVGSREFSRSEIRERLGSTGGVVLTSMQGIETTIGLADNTKDRKAAFAAYVKLLAADLQLNHFTPAQYSDSGSSLWNRLDEFRPDGGTFSRWITADMNRRFPQLMAAVRSHLPSAVVQAQRDTNRTSKAVKIAKALAPMVANQCF